MDWTPAVVRLWHEDRGWGVLDSPATPGGCWAHFSALDMDGHATATTGQTARLVPEQAQQDGFFWRAVSVRLDGVPARTQQDAVESDAYGSALHLEVD